MYQDKLKVLKYSPYEMSRFSYIDLPVILEVPVGLPHLLSLSCRVYPFVLSWDFCMCMNSKSVIFVCGYQTITGQNPHTQMPSPPFFLKMGTKEKGWQLDCVMCPTSQYMNYTPGIHLGQLNAMSFTFIYNHRSQTRN